MLKPAYDDEYPPDRTVLWAAIVTAVGGVVAAVLPEVLKSRRRTADRLDRLERENAQLRAQLEATYVEDDDDDDYDED